MRYLALAASLIVMSAPVFADSEYATVTKHLDADSLVWVKDDSVLSQLSTLNARIQVLEEKVKKLEMEKQDRWTTTSPYYLYNSVPGVVTIYD